MRARHLPVVVVSIFCVGCASSGPPPAVVTTSPLRDAEAAAAAVTVLADEYVLLGLQRWPDLITLFALPDADHSGLPDESPSALVAWATREDEWAARLAQIDPELLWGRPEWVTHGFLQQRLEAGRGERVCRMELWQVNQLSGWHVRFAEVAARQPVGTPELRAQALTRWRSLPAFINTHIENLREGIRLGYTASRFNVERVLEQLEALIAAPGAASPYHAPARQDTTPEFRHEWEALLRNEIIPAIQRYRDYLRDEYLPAARTSLSLSALPNGPACYRAMLRSYTGLDPSGEEVHEAGRREMAERMTAFRRLGERLYSTSDPVLIRERMRAADDTRFASREEIVRVSADVVARARQALPRWFGLTPRANVVIEPIPVYQERSRPPQYQAASEDGSRPAIYHINLYEPERQLRGDVEVLAFHETYPGHHVQVAIALERRAAHPITRYASNAGFVEGWGSYAETLADEMGLYTSGASRLVLYSRIPAGMIVDPGIHVLGWTRQQAIAWLLANVLTATPEGAEAFVDRIAVWPGQAVAYAVGKREILKLREQARAALGARFDIAEFHDRVLEDGSVTLPMLRRKIERWIAERLAGDGSR